MDQVTGEGHKEGPIYAGGLTLRQGCSDCVCVQCLTVCLPMQSNHQGQFEQGHDIGKWDFPLFVYFDCLVPLLIHLCWSPGRRSFSEGNS